MNRNEIPQWDEIYPNREVLLDDIEKEQLYIGCSDNKIASVFVLNNEYDPLYIEGKWEKPEESYIVLHRLCVSPLFQRGGIGSKTVLAAEDAAKTIGVNAIRLDAFTLNPYAVKMYENLGYKTVGTVEFRKGPFFLMEKYFN